jgi:hypothetical protein
MADCFDATETADYELVESQRQKELALERQRVADFRTGAADGAKLETALQKGFDEGFERGGAISEAIYTSLGILKSAITVMSQQRDRKAAAGKRKRVVDKDGEVSVDSQIVLETGNVDNEMDAKEEVWISSAIKTASEITGIARPVFNFLMAKGTDDGGKDAFEILRRSIVNASALIRTMPITNHESKLEEKGTGIEALCKILEECEKTCIREHEKVTKNS